MVKMGLGENAPIEFVRRYAASNACLSCGDVFEEQVGANRGKYLRSVGRVASSLPGARYDGFANGYGLCRVV